MGWCPWHWGFIDPIVPTTILNYTRSSSQINDNKTDIIQKIKNLLFILARKVLLEGPLELEKEYKIPINLAKSTYPSFPPTQMRKFQGQNLYLIMNH